MYCICVYKQRNNLLPDGEATSLHLPEGVSSWAVSVVPATQVYTTSSLHLFLLALPQPEEKKTQEEEGRNFHLQPRRLLPGMFIS